MIFRPILLSVLLIFSLSHIYAQGGATATDKSDKKIYNTKHVGSTAPTIDGDLSDAIWQSVPWGGDFIQRQPNEGEAPTRDTKFKILYDAKNLYVAFKCLDDAPDEVVKRLSRRDGFDGDWVEINIDSYHDLRTAFSFTITAAGVKGDEAISNDGQNWDSSWDPIWYVKSAIVEDGWVAEARIPLSQLRFSNQENQVWGLQINRRDFRQEERSNWQFVPNNTNSWVSSFGELHGIVGIKPQKQLEIQPYVLGKIETYKEEEGNPFAPGKDYNGAIGLDGKIGLTSDFTIDFTINPDFGQVEADPSALALDGFQIFFNERRPFFIEGRNIFNYRLTSAEAGGPFNGDRLFYSRRIGGAPHGYPDVSDDEYVDQPVNTSILGAAKFTGKSKNGFSIGILESVTQKEFAKIDKFGDRSEELVEPLTNYFVGRVQQDLREGQTVIGGIFTAANRKNTNSPVDFLHKDAYSGGLDFLHRWKEQMWYVAGNANFSKVSGTAASITRTQERFEHLFQRVDADHLSVDTTLTSLAGHGGSIRLGKSGGGKRFNFDGGVSWRSPEFEINDLGFNRNTDEIIHFLWAGFRIDKPFSIFRNFRANYNHWTNWDFAGNHNYLGWNVNLHTQFKNFYSIGSGVNTSAVNVSSRALRGGPRLRTGNFINNWMYANSDQRKKIVFYWNMYHYWNFENESRTKNYSLFAQWQALNTLTISLGPRYSENKDVLQFVENTETPDGTPRYINGTVHQKTLSATVNINLTVNPTLSIQYYGSPFISRGNYTDFKYITDALGNTFADRQQPYTDAQINYVSEDDQYIFDEDLDGETDYSIGNPDFNFMQFPFKPLSYVGNIFRVRNYSSFGPRVIRILVILKKI